VASISVGGNFFGSTEERKLYGHPSISCGLSGFIWDSPNIYLSRWQIDQKDEDERDHLISCNVINCDYDG
jgi:hypothetical protein